MKRCSIFLFLLVLQEIGLGQQNRAMALPINTWRSYPVPNDSAVLDHYGDDTTNWSLFLEKGQIFTLNAYRPGEREYIPGDTIPNAVHVSLWKDEMVETRQSKRIMSVDDGYIIGINNGEWGGKIVWYSKDGKHKYKISDEKVIEFVRKDDRIFAIEGNNHLNTSDGTLIEVKKNNEKWVSQCVSKLPFAPFGVSINDHENFIIGTSDNIIEVEQDGKYRVLYSNPVWNQFYIYLYPKSLLLKDNTLYVGMRKGVFKYDLHTGVRQWLMRD